MGFQAGAARRDITPPQDWIDAGLIWLWGYGDRSAPCSGVADPLDARAVCIRDDDGAHRRADHGRRRRPRSGDDRAGRARLEASHGLARSQVGLNVSHTHSAPVAASIPTWQPGVAEARADYLALLEDAIVGAVDDAFAALRPATIEFGRGTTNVAVDRHVDRRRAAGSHARRRADHGARRSADRRRVRRRLPPDVVRQDSRVDLGRLRRPRPRRHRSRSPADWPCSSRAMPAPASRPAASPRRWWAPQLAADVGRGRSAARWTSWPGDQLPARRRRAAAAAAHPRQRRARSRQPRAAAAAVGGMDGHARRGRPGHAADAVAVDDASVPAAGRGGSSPAATR